MHLDSTPTTTDTLAPTRPDPSFWSSVREALRGSHVDYTEGPVNRAILLLAIPMVLEMAMESVFAVVDVFVVSRLGPDAVATVGLTESLLTVLYAIAMGLSVGAMAMVARRTGEKDTEGAARTAVQAVGLGVLLALPIAITGIIFARPLLSAMGASPWVLEHGVTYARIMLGSTVSILLLFLLNAIFRGAGDAAVAMRTLWLANGINIVLGPCLVFGLGPFPALGVTGAAAATACGRSVGVVYQLVHLARGGGRVQVALRHLRLELGTMLTMLRLSLSGIFQMLVSTTSWVGLMRIVAGFGSAAVASYTISIRIILFALLPAFGLANAAATLVGQSLGAGKPERGEQAVWRAGLYNLGFLGALGFLFLVGAEPLIGIFTQDALVAPVAVTGLRILSAGFVFFAFGMVLTQAFNGAGDTWTPTWLNLACFWALELPLGYALANPLGMGPRGVFLAVTVAFSTLAVAAVVLFRRGTWKERKL